MQNQFQIEEERSKQFLAKLNSIQKVSKEIKHKNIHSVQRQEWSKEFQNLQKMEKQLSSDLEQRLLAIEVQSGLPKFNLAAQLERDRISYNDLKDEIIYQLSSMKRLISAKKGELVPEIGSYFKQMSQKLDAEFQEYYEMDEECEENIDMYTQNKRQLIRFSDAIQQEFLNDKLLQYAESSDGNEAEIFQQYSRALNFLHERYQLEIKALDTKDYMQLDETMLYLAGSNQLHAMQRLMLHYPKMNRAQLQQIVDYVRQQKDISKRLDILRRNWRIEYSQLSQKTENLLQDMHKDQELRNQRWLDYLQLKQHRIKLAQDLEDKRVIYDQKQREIQEQQELKQLQQQELDKQQQEEWIEHKAQISAQAQQYKAEKEIKRQQEQLEAQIKEQMINQELQLKIQEAKPLIQQRNQKEYDKIQDKIIQREQKVVNKIENQQRIENAINSYSIRPKVERDITRTQAQTEAKLIRQRTKYDKADKIPLSNVQGFNIEQLMSDMRYRLQAALSDAGLGQAKYGHELINHMSKQQQF